MAAQQYRRGDGGRTPHAAPCVASLLHARTTTTTSSISQPNIHSWTATTSRRRRLTQVRRVGRQQQQEGLQRGLGAGLPLVGAVDKLHHGGKACVEPHLLGLLGDLRGQREGGGKQGSGAGKEGEAMRRGGRGGRHISAEQEQSLNGTAARAFF